MKEKNAIMNANTLKDKIYIIRNQQVMLDVDLAEIYGYTTSSFNQQVKRNIDRFPTDFLFELTKEKMIALSISQNVISIQKEGIKGGRSKPVKAFTESGIYMLMTVLRGDLAIRQSIILIRLFKEMKDYIIDNPPIINRLSYMDLINRIQNHQSRINEIEKNMVTKAHLSEFEKLFSEKVSNEEILVLNGQPFKADMAFQKLYSRAKNNIIVIDNYLGIKTLHHLSMVNKKIQIIILSDNKGRPPLRLIDYEDFRTEYLDREISFIKTNNQIHDRYIILDYGTRDMKVYLCGSSSKDSGNKITTIIQIHDISEYKQMIQTVLLNSELVLT